MDKITPQSLKRLLYALASALGVILLFLTANYFLAEEKQPGAKQFTRKTVPQEKASQEELQTEPEKPSFILLPR